MNDWKAFTELQEEYGRLRKEHHLLGRMLKRLEWSNNDSELAECPYCGNWRRIGHTNDCELAKLICEMPT